eukprot:725281-Ditylum_brightwellii.AAC.1
MSMTHLSAGGLCGCIPLTDVTGEAVDISKYLGLGFYNKVGFKDNDGLFPQEPEIHQRLKRNDKGYKGLRPNHCDWSDMMEEDPDFAKEFRIVFNNQDIPEADELTPKVLEDTYTNVGIE